MVPAYFIELGANCGANLASPISKNAPHVGGRPSVWMIPLAAVLWNGGISFGGVIAFIFADLIVLPILNIYRKYYGPRMAGFLFVTFYASMAAAALLVEAIFGVLGPVPEQRHARVVDCFASSPAEPRTSSAEVPTWPNACVTPAMFCMPPCAPRCTLREISCVVALDRQIEAPRCIRPACPFDRTGTAR
jgi:hypothetical protein